MNNYRPLVLFSSVSLLLTVLCCSVHLCHSSSQRDYNADNNNNRGPSLFETEAEMSCCPSGSWGELAPAKDYTPKGVVETLEGGLNVYRVGEGER